MNNKNNMDFDLHMFGADLSASDFFINAYNESLDNSDDNNYDDGISTNNGDGDQTIDDTSPNALEATTEPDNSIDDNVNDQNNDSNIQSDDSTNTQQTTNYNKEDLEKMFSEYMEKHQQQTSPTNISNETNPSDELVEYLNKNPDLVNMMRQYDAQGQQMASKVFPNESEQKISELENMVVELKYESEVNKMKTKYSDYDADKVLDYSIEHDINDLETAYHAMKGATVGDIPKIDEEALREKIKEEVRAEIEKEMLENSKSTSTTTISSVDSIPNLEEVNLTKEQLKMARLFNMTDKEYFDSLMGS